METNDKLLGAALAQWVGTEHEQVQFHPGAARMQSYLEGTLTPAEQSELQEHMSVCTSCAQELLQLETFLLSEISESDLREASAIWPGVRLRLAAEGTLPLAAKAPPTTERLSRATSWFPLPLNWAFGMLSLALLVTTLYFGAQLRGYRNPRVNTMIADLIPATATPAFRGNTDPQHVIVSEKTDRVLLVLNVSAPTSYPSYALEIREGREANGRLLWTTKALDRTQSGNFNLDLEGNFLPDGYYMLRVLGFSRGQRDLLGEYFLYIQHER